MLAKNETLLKQPFFLIRLAFWFKQAWDYRVTANALARLSDEQLKDIGLLRHQVQSGDWRTS